MKEGETVAIGGAMFLMEGTSAPPAAQTPPPSPAVATPVPAAPAEVTPSPEKRRFRLRYLRQPLLQSFSPFRLHPLLRRRSVPVPVAAQVIVPTFEGDLSSDVIPAGPAIRRFAREVGVELSQVTGTGDAGRITREDVLAVVRQTSHAVRTSTAPQSVATAPVNSSNSAPSSPSKTSDAKGATGQDEYGPIRVEKMAKIRKTIAAQMHKSWSTVPRVVNFDDADVTELEAFRQSSKDDYASRGIKLTTMPFLIKAVATALKHHPAINAVIDVENEQIIYKEYVNIGIAIDTERGLIVPTLKSADKMPIPDIAKAMNFRDEFETTISPSPNCEVDTFTISNLGAIGGTYSTPIVNVPEVAILLVGRSRKLPVVMEDDSIKVDS